MTDDRRAPPRTPNEPTNRRLAVGDALVALVLLAVGGWVRVRYPGMIGPELDWAWLISAAHDLATLRLPEGPGAYLYTSLPAVAFAPLLALFGMIGALVAWGFVHATAGPILWLALRRPAGRGAAFLTSALLAVQPAEVAIGRGLESPYMVSPALALLVAGAVSASERRPSGPPLLVLGGALATGMHPGLFLLAIGACLVAAVETVLLRHGRWRAIGASAIAGGGGPLALFFLLDLDRISLELRGLGGHVSSTTASSSSMDLVQALSGFTRSPAPIAVILVGLAVVPSLLVWRFIARLRGSSTVGLTEGPRPLGIWARLAALLVLGAIPYLAVRDAGGYESQEGSLFVLVISLATLGPAALAPSLPRSTARAAAALGILVFVIASASDIQRTWTEAPKPQQGTSARGVSASLRWAELARTRAERDGLRPWIYAELSPCLRSRVEMHPDVLNALARLGPYGSGESAACLVLAEVASAEPLQAEILRLEGDEDAPEIGYLYDPNCELLRGQPEAVCAAFSHGIHPPQASETPEPPVGWEHLSCLGF